MISLYFKNLLNLLKNSIETFEIICKNDNCLNVSISTDLGYNFNFKSANQLIPNCSYIISLVDIHRLFKYVTSDSIINFIHDQLLNKFIISIVSVKKSNIIQSLELPLLVSPSSKPTLSPSSIPTVGIVVYLNDLSRILKSLKNTGDNYNIAVENDFIVFTNNDGGSTIPISYKLQSLTGNTSSLQVEPWSISITNNCILKLNKLPCNTSPITISYDKSTDTLFLLQNVDNVVAYFISIRQETVGRKIDKS